MLKYLASTAIIALSLSTPAMAQSDSKEVATQSQGSQSSDKGLRITLPDGLDDSALGKRDMEIVAVQAMLDRSRHSPGVIDGYRGGNTSRAIAAYRRNHDLPAGDGVDDELLRSLLDTQSGDVIREYTITSDDVDGPFYDVPSGFAEQASLDRVGYKNAHEMLAEKFHMDQNFLADLNPGVDFSQSGQTIFIVAHGEETLSADIARIEIRKGEGAVVLMDSSGNEIASYPATIGSDEFPSPSGAMSVAAIAPDANYTFDPNDQEWGPDKTFIIPPGPNNPIGGTWIDLGEKGYGIHGSPDPQLIGKTTSHGCVRLTNWDANEVASAVSQGVEVVFTSS